MANTPIETIQVGRGIKATIWANINNGKEWHSITLSRTYSDKDGKLHDSTSFRKEHLPLVEKAADAAWRYLQERHEEPEATE